MPDLRFNRTLLHSAAIENDLPTVEKLIAGGAEIEAKDEFGDTPLMAAVESDSVDCARALLKAGAARQYVFQREDSPAARQKQEREARQIMSDVEAQCGKMFEDFSDTEAERLEAFEESIASQVDFAFQPDAKSVVEGCSTLSMAKLLFEEFRIEPGHIGGDGYHPLKLFAEGGDAEAVAWLLERGYPVDLKSTGDTALHAAVREDSLECAKLLLDAGADPNAQDCDGWNLLFSVGSQAMLDLLLARGAEIEPDIAAFLPSDFVEDDMKPALRELEKAAGYAESEGKKLLEE